MNAHLQIKTKAQNEGKVITDYADGSFSVQSADKRFATMYKPDGTEHRMDLTESLDALTAYDYPRK
jgi:hypothetical protein